MSPAHVERMTAARVAYWHARAWLYRSGEADGAGTSSGAEAAIVDWVSMRRLLGGR